MAKVRWKTVRVAGSESPCTGLMSSTCAALGRWGALALFLLGSIAAQAEVKVSVRLSPNPISPNQVTNLTLTVEDGDVQQVPELNLPSPLGLAGAPTTGQQVIFSNGVQSTVLQVVWPVTSPSAGMFAIPPFQVQVSGKIYNTQPLKLEVREAADTPKPDGPNHENGLGQYDSILQLQVSKTEFYQGEVVPISATLYVPGSVQLLRSGLIEVEKTDFAIQRFPQMGEQSLETLGRIRYRGFTYRTTLSALKSGKARIGPAKMDNLVDIPTNNNRGGGFFGFPQVDRKKVTVEAPEIMVTVLPLPAEGRPKGFTGAVGDFTMQATTAMHDVTVGDPVSVDMVVEGQGNFDALDAPKLTDAAGWKVYPARRYNVDTSDPNTVDLMNRRIGFATILVPEKVMAAVPAFEFSFFSPRTKKYTTLRSQAIPLNVKPSDKVAPPVLAPVASAPGITSPVTNPVPEPDITDILVRLPLQPHWAMASVPLLADNRFTRANFLLFACFVVLVGGTMFKRWQQRRAHSSDHERRSLWRQLEVGGLSEAEFHRRAAHYLHYVAGDKDLPEAARELLAKYEALNFAGPQAGSAPVSAADRAKALAVLKQLKPAVLSTASPLAASTALLLLASLAQAGQAADLTTAQNRYQAAAQALEKNDFTTARNLAESLVQEGRIAPELFLLLGHATYKLKEPGTAAIWYQRAALFPGHGPELRQNLRHLSERYPFFSFRQNELLRAIGFQASRNTWAVIATVSAWLAAFSVALLALGARPPLRAWVIGALTLSLLGFALGALGWSMRPEYRALKDLAFVSAPDAMAHTAAAQISGHVILVPPGSTVRKLEERGTWSYVEIPQSRAEDNLHGWLPTADLVPVWPYEPALLP